MKTIEKHGYIKEDSIFLNQNGKQNTARLKAGEWVGILSEHKGLYLVMSKYHDGYIPKCVVEILKSSDDFGVRIHDGKPTYGQIKAQSNPVEVYPRPRGMRVVG